MSLKKHLVSTLLVSIIMPLSAFAAGSSISASAVKAPDLHTTTGGLCRWQMKDGKSWNPCYGYADSPSAAKKAKSVTANGGLQASAGGVGVGGKDAGSQGTTGGLCQWECINGVYQNGCGDKDTTVTCKGVSNGGTPGASINSSIFKKLN